ncbi:uracil DNA glycosylase [Coemansia sp. BCRC 34490]|nr:uracil DNA glycosylase [Coemansia sp. BCRC 34490]
MPKAVAEKRDTGVSSSTSQRKTIDAYFNPIRRAPGKPERAKASAVKVSSKGKEPEAADSKPAPVSAVSLPAAQPQDPDSSNSNQNNSDSAKKDEHLVRREAPADRPELKLEYETMEASWLEHLEAEFSKPYFRQLKEFLKSQADQGKTIFPPAHLVYSWTRYAPLPSVRVVILGQDPYHGPGQAHGLAFSVQPQVRVPPSLVNIYKALAKDFADFQRPAHGFLRGWAEQGVLLLNAALTVECHKANAHAGRGWEQFTDRVISLVNDHNDNVVFMLWGAYAQKKGARVDRSRHCVLSSVHPSPLSASRGFFDAGHFRRANEYLAKHGRQPIDWSRLPAEEK